MIWAVTINGGKTEDEFLDAVFLPVVFHNLKSCILGDNIHGVIARIAKSGRRGRCKKLAGTSCQRDVKNGLGVNHSICRNLTAPLQNIVRTDSDGT